MGGRLPHDKNAKDYPFSCLTCWDTGEYWDAESKRNRPCPNCDLGKHTY